MASMLRLPRSAQADCAHGMGVEQRLARCGTRAVEVRAGTPRQFDAFVAGERAKPGRAVKDSGATAD